MLIKHGNIHIEIHFADAVAQTLTVIAVAVDDNLLKVDQGRNAAFNYTSGIVCELSVCKKNGSQSRKYLKSIRLRRE